MEHTLAAILGGTLILLGAIGCVVPVLPGPLLAYGALWLLVAFGMSPGNACLLSGAAVLAVAMVLDYILPAMFAKRFQCSKLGVVGCMVGSIVGLFFMPFGIILGPFLGTMAGELLAGKNLAAAVKGGIGSFFGFIGCLILKFAAVSLYAYWFVARLAQ